MNREQASKEPEFYLREVVSAAREAVDALAARWMRVDCNEREERAIRYLNDALVALDVNESGFVDPIPEVRFK